MSDEVDYSKMTDKDGKPLSKNAIKKLKKIDAARRDKEKRAADRAAKKGDEEKKAAEEHARKLEEAKSIVLTEDPSLPKATKILIEEVSQFVGQRVKIHGWVHFLRSQGGIIFIELRDGSGFPSVLQVVLADQLAATYDALTLHREAAITVIGELVEDDRAKGGVELKADYWELVGPSDADIENIVSRESNVPTLFDQRHIVLRSMRTTNILKLRSIATHCFREHFFDKGFFEVTPPTLVQTQVEGGATLFQLNYYGEEKTYLTQSSQLYLETVVPTMGKVFCCMPSYRAEKARTRRHLSEFTHFEAEMGFITFEDLLQYLEDMCVNVAERLLSKAGDMVHELNPTFTVPKRPFKRMNYSDAVKFCNEHDIYKDEEKKEHFVFGDDIPEGPERKMTDMIGEPILLTRFPAHMKSFYMSRCPEDNDLTESVDLLMPGVGEIIGGSMRSWKLDELKAGFEREGISTKEYYWYLDMRKYGSCPHGGFGLGMERYLCWLLGVHHIREVCLFPRYMGRCKP